MAFPLVVWKQSAFVSRLVKNCGVAVEFSRDLKTRLSTHQDADYQELVANAKKYYKNTRWFITKALKFTKNKSFWSLLCATKLVIPSVLV